MADPIRGLVASLLTSRELVINRGSDHGVTKGMKFAVLNRQGLGIKDPETDEELGSVAIPKVIVEASRVDPRLTVARTFNKRRTNVGGQFSGLGLAAMFEPPKWIDEWETLRTDQKPLIKELPPSESYVEIGDPVVEVRGDDYVVTE